MNPRLHPPARLARSILPSQSDERLTELARSGSDAAFETLVARHRRGLVRHCARVLGDNDAEEAVQEALMRAYAALQRGDPVRHVRPWLHVIARNAALNLLRTRNARGETAPVDGCDGVGAEDGSLEQRRRLRELVSAMNSLPARQRDAILMREFEGRSYAEIGDRLGASPGAVRQLLNRARTTVRERLAVLLPWETMFRWAVGGSSRVAGQLGGSAGAAGAVGARIGALSDTCVVAAKVCAALVPAAALGIGGLSVATHLDPGSRHHRAGSSPAGQTRTTAGGRRQTTTATAAPAGVTARPGRATVAPASARAILPAAGRTTFAASAPTSAPSARTTFAATRRTTVRGRAGTTSGVSSARRSASARVPGARAASWVRAQPEPVSMQLTPVDAGPSQQGGSAGTTAAPGGTTAAPSSSATRADSDSTRAPSGDHDSNRASEMQPSGSPDSPSGREPAVAPKPS